MKRQRSGAVPMEPWSPTTVAVTVWRWSRTVTPKRTNRVFVTVFSETAAVCSRTVRGTLLSESSFQTCSTTAARSRSSISGESYPASWMASRTASVDSASNSGDTWKTYGSPLRSRLSWTAQWFVHCLFSFGGFPLVWVRFSRRRVRRRCAATRPERTTRARTAHAPDPSRPATAGGPDSVRASEHDPHVEFAQWP